MPKKRVASAFDVIAAVARLEAAIGRIETALADIATAIADLTKQIEPERINPDRRYRIPELEQFGIKPGRLYKAHKDVIRNEGRSAFVLGRDVLMLNETAPKLFSKAATNMTALPRRRGRPRKDAKRSTTDDSTDSLTIRNVVAGDNGVVRVPPWMHRTEECFGPFQKAA